MTEPLQLKFVSFSKGAYITVEGNPEANQFYIIRQGKVQISKETEIVVEERGNILGPGDFFAVVSTMSAHSHIESALALTDVSLIAVRKEQFPQLIRQNTPVAMKIILQFSRRMRYLDEALTELTFDRTSEGNDAHLFDIGEYYAKRNQYPQAFYAYHQYLTYNPRGALAATARMRMMKIAPYAKGVRLSFPDDEVFRTYPPGNMIFSEREQGDELFIIQSGAVKITKIVDNSEVLLAVLKAGDIFGEMALLESKPRAASAVAYESCTVKVVNRANFEQMITRDPQMITRLTSLLAERIWSVYKQLANTLIPDPLGRLYDALLIQLEKSRIPPSYTDSFYFDIGPAELVNMVGLSPEEGRPFLQKLLENSLIKIEDDRLYVVKASEIFRQSGYYKRISRRDRVTGKRPVPAG